MDIWEVDKFLLFVAFVIPGFISIKSYQLVFPGTQRLAVDQIVDAVAYSSINYAILSPLIFYVENSGLENSHGKLYLLFYFFVFFLAPIFWVFAWKFLRTKNFLQKHAPHPTGKPWDYFFGKRLPCWVKLTLKDGNVIGGLYGDQSFASSAPSEEQMYLQESWKITKNGAFEKSKDRTLGLLISMDQVSYIEFRRWQ